MESLQFRDIVIAQGCTASAESEMGQGENTGAPQGALLLRNEQLLWSRYGSHLSDSCSLWISVRLGKNFLKKRVVNHYNMLTRRFLLPQRMLISG